MLSADWPADAEAPKPFGHLDSEQFVCVGAQALAQFVGRCLGRREPDLILDFRVQQQALRHYAIGDGEDKPQSTEQVQGRSALRRRSA